MKKFCSPSVTTSSFVGVGDEVLCMVSHRCVGSVWRQIYYSQALGGVAGHPWKYLPQCNREKKVTPPHLPVCKETSETSPHPTHGFIMLRKQARKKKKKLHTNWQTRSLAAVRSESRKPRGEGVLRLGGRGVPRSLFHSSSIASMINTSIDFMVRHHSGQIRVRVPLFHPWAD